MAPLSGPFDKTGTWGGVMGGIGEKHMPLKNRTGSYYLILECFLHVVLRHKNMNLRSKRACYRNEYVLKSFYHFL